MVRIGSLKSKALDIIAWGLIFLICLNGNAFIFGTNFIALPTLVYTVLMVLLVYANHLAVVKFGASLIRARRWISFSMLLLAVYVASVLVIILPLDFLSSSFPNMEQLNRFARANTIKSVAGVFSYINLVWVLSLVLLPNMIAAAYFFFKRNYEANKRNAMLQKEKTEMELSFLRAQIHPHFLFNTLNNIYGMVMENEKAGQVVLKLSDLLRFTLYESSGKRIPVGREVEFLSDYINLEQIRHHNTRVAISYNFAHIKSSETPIVPLLLISFVENAFKHGVNATIGKAWVHLSLKQENHTILFEVENSKPATKKERPATAGIGIENTKRRLALLYPEKHQLNITETADSYKVSLTLHTHD